MIFIAYNYANKVSSIVSARTEELAKAFWHGKGLLVQYSQCLEDPKEFTPLNEHPTGVIPLLDTIEVKAGSCDKDAKLLCVK